MVSQALRSIGIVAAGLSFAAGAKPAWAQLEPERLYYGVHRAAPMVCRVPASEADAAPEIRLIDPESGEVLETTTAAAGRVDVAAMFPVLWTAERPKVLLAQLAIDGREVGPPVVLEPMLTPRRVLDGETARLMDAYAQRNADFFAQLLRLPADAREELQRTAVAEPEPPGGRVHSGLRAYSDRLVVLETSAGEMVFSLRPDQAPNTVFAFIGLVEGGFYTNVPFHRIIAEDREGRPFIVQSGDPSGTGAGGAPAFTDFEPSALAHDFGVLSIARRPDDPNSNSSQFFICLGREACAALDGKYVAIGQLISGGDVLQTIAATPVRGPEPEGSTAALERPADPPLILRAYTKPAPPFSMRARPLTIEDVPPVER